MANKLSQRDQANLEVLSIFQNAKPAVVDIAIARDVIPGLTENMILHAGPPITWDRMCGPMKGAVLGALVYEGKAATLEQAADMCDRGQVVFEPNHDHSAVAPMAGVISPSMPVWVLRDEHNETTAYCNLNEGPGATLRYGANGPKVIENLHWMSKTLAPRLKLALKQGGPIPIFPIVQEALEMGDECHSRNRSALSLFIIILTKRLLATTLTKVEINEVLDFLVGRDYFFLNLTMPACKASWLKAEKVSGSSIVTAFARNGVEWGVRVQGKWFTAPSPVVNGHYFTEFTRDDANLDIGDSAITEASGLGGFAAVGSPSVTGFIGGTASELTNANLEMYEITTTESKHFKLTALDGRGTPFGVDVFKVVETGVTPFVTTGVAHRLPGIGQIGAGRTEVDTGKSLSMKAN
ncbi:hypothetical protein BC938DRAFT_476070 [Jimgerdemannia flammicorona]|uniref:DUF1116 domain-containing protein n=1 Tax=Jimgerdemannia flammicorona TaxID=994334 RepID=A0A433PKU6_9FUNG|nr:hypothetical protein BC938DRAFT_476070 [Jimgerdemannia flammicorona]